MPARVYPLDRDEVAAGETALVQFRLLEDAVVPVGEPFVIRTPSPVETVGGGVIIDAVPGQAHPARRGRAPRVQTLRTARPPSGCARSWPRRGTAGLDCARSRSIWACACPGLSANCPALPVVRCSGDLVLDRAAFETSARARSGRSDAFHAANPTWRGMPREDLRRKLPAGFKPAAYSRVLDELARQGALETADGLVRRAGWSRR